jgi:predicted amidohydrolase
VQSLNHVDCDLIVLPELALTGYFFADRTEAYELAEEPSNSSSVSSLVALCRQRRFHMVIGFAERDKDRVFNSALLIGPDGVEHIYRKLHLFNTEKNCFDPGDTPFTVQTVRDTKIGMMICFDWIFPEATRTLSLLGAQVICHPSNLVLSYCQQSMTTRCLENSVFAVTANRFGADERPHGSVRFTGKSQITGPKGEILNRAASQRQALCVMDIDPEQADDKNITPHNQIITDRRPEFYRALTA